MKSDPKDTAIKPDDVHSVNQDVAAAVLGISTRQLRKHKDAPRNHDGGYDLTELVKWRIRDKMDEPHEWDRAYRAGRWGGTD